MAKANQGGGEGDYSRPWQKKEKKKNKSKSCLGSLELHRYNVIILLLVSIVNFWVTMVTGTCSEGRVQRIMLRKCTYNASHNAPKTAL